MKTMIIIALILTAGIIEAKETITKNKRKTASTHHCIADALKRAPKLLKLQTPAAQIIVDDESVQVDEVNTIGGQGKYDVIQIQVLDGNSPYQTRFLYQQNVTTCNLMGQEILDLKNPY